MYCSKNKKALCTKHPSVDKACTNYVTPVLKGVTCIPGILVCLIGQCCSLVAVLTCIH